MIVLQGGAPAWQGIASFGPRRNQTIRPADYEHAARYVAVPFCTGICSFVASPGPGSCRPVPGRADPRHDRRPRIDHVVGSTRSSAACHRLVSQPALAGPYGSRIGWSITHRSRQGRNGRSSDDVSSTRERERCTPCCRRIPLPRRGSFLGGLSSCNLIWLTH
jgi:hypothetical protein